MTKKQLQEQDLRMTVSHKTDLLSYFKNLVKHFEEDLDNTKKEVIRVEQELLEAVNMYDKFIRKNTEGRGRI